MKILLRLVSKTLPLILTLFCLLIFRLQHRQIQALTEQNQALTHTFSTQSQQFQATLKAIETTNEISKQHFYASETQWADSQANKIFIKKPLAIMSVLTGLCLLPLLSGCTSTQAEYVTLSYPVIPAPLLADCLPPVIATQMSWGEMLILNEVLLTMIEQCNIDKQAIRAIERERQHEKTC